MIFPHLSDSHKAYVQQVMDKLAEHEARNPGDVAPIYNGALMHLSIGNFEAGWPMFKYRLCIPECRYSFNKFPVKVWSGQDVKDTHLLVWLDQGVGDQILAASMLNDLQRMVGLTGSITVIASRRLVNLFCLAFPLIHFHRTGDDVSERLKTFDFDYQLSMSEIGQLTRPTFDKCTGKPFLMARPRRAKHFRQKYAQHGKPVIGISWQSQSKVAADTKSFLLEDLDPLLSLDATFVNLQYDPYQPELDEAETKGHKIITDPEVDQLLDLDVFASQLKAMDFIVTASSSMVHLAGALGVPCAVILPKGKGCHWYWGAEGEDTIWYESLWLVRQQTVGDWSVPIKAATDFVRENIVTPKIKVTALG